MSQHELCPCPQCPECLSVPLILRAHLLERPVSEYFPKPDTVTLPAGVVRELANVVAWAERVTSSIEDETPVRNALSRMRALLESHLPKESNK